MAFLVDDDVVGLEVPENDVLFVERLDAEQDLLDVQLGLLLAEALLDLEVLAEVAAGAVVRDEEKVVLRLESVPQLHYEGVLAHTTHDVSLGDGILLQVVPFDLLL